MNDIPFDEIIASVSPSDETEDRSGFRPLRKGPVIFEAHLCWSWLKDTSGPEEEPQDGTLELLCAWFPKQEKSIHELSRQYGDNLLQMAFETTTTHTGLLAQSYEAGLFEKFKEQLKALGYPIAPEGHA